MVYPASVPNLLLREGRAGQPVRPFLLDKLLIVWYICIMSNWKDIAGYEGLYQVSDGGQVRSLDRVSCYGRRLKGRTLRATPNDKSGHLAVGLWSQGKQRTLYVHRLVAAAFIGPCPDGQEVRHGANGIGDNSVGNLCYGTRSENLLDCRRDGTKGTPVVRGDGVEFANMAIAAESSGCSPQNIWTCCNGKQKTTGGFSWKYFQENS